MSAQAQVPVTFKGGSLGGETRDMPISQVGQGWKIEVPVITSPAPIAGMAAGSSPVQNSSFIQETYVVRPGSGGYEAVWQNPAATASGLEEELAKVKAENGRLERMVERLIGLFDDDDERMNLLGWLAQQEEAGAEPV